MIRHLSCLGMALAVVLTAAPAARAATYSIPAEQPTGTVDIQPLGVSDAEPTAGTTVPVLRVRVTLSNAYDDVPWTVDTRTLIASIEGEGTSRPAFVNADAGSPPLISVGYGETRTLDLYYPISDALAGSQPAFSLSWRVSTPVGLVSNSCAFGAEALPAAQVALPVYPIWYSDPIYPRYAFRHRPVFRYAPQVRVAVRPRGFRGHYAPPARVYAPAPAVHVAPPRVYAPPARVYAPAPAVHVAPARVYAPPARVYAPPARVYAPAPAVHVAPARVYAPPARVYAPPARVYAPTARAHAPAAPVYAPAGQGHGGHGGNGGNGGGHGQGHGGWRR